MTATEILRQEHDVILRVLDAAQHEVHVIEETRSVRADVVEKMVDFFRNFADRCHHAKEEKHLFVKMQERGMPAFGGPIAVMLEEHEAGRYLVKTVTTALPGARSGDLRAVEDVQGGLTAYIELLRHHIMKENNVLYPMADRLFTPEDQTALQQEFERIEREDIGSGVHGTYHRLAEELAAR